MLLSDRIFAFYKQLDLNSELPEGIGVMNPYLKKNVFELVRRFYQQYYADNQSRILLLGINPGRFGAGITGIPFTDPYALESFCGIANTLDKRRETSSVFIYDMIKAFGSVDSFYKKVFIGAISPLGFVSNGKNLNYYDKPELQQALYPFISRQFRNQAELCADRRICISIGEGKNLAFLKKLNAAIPLFDEIAGLPHPRFIMQYRYKRKDEFIGRYLDLLDRF